MKRESTERKKDRSVGGKRVTIGENNLTYVTEDDIESDGLSDVENEPPIPSFASRWGFCRVFYLIYFTLIFLFFYVCLVFLFILFVFVFAVWLLIHYRGFELVFALDFFNLFLILKFNYLTNLQNTAKPLKIHMLFLSPNTKCLRTYLLLLDIQVSLTASELWTKWARRTC